MYLSITYNRPCVQFKINLLYLNLIMLLITFQNVDDEIYIQKYYSGAKLFWFFIHLAIESGDLTLRVST